MAENRSEVPRVMIYPALNEPVLARVPAAARNILDVGCGTGTLGERLKSRQACHVTGITYSPAEAALAGKVLDDVLMSDLNQLDATKLGQYDCIVCSHVLEHLFAPEKLLAQLRPHLKADGLLLVALPNVLHWRQRMEFLLGRWQYADCGLLDRTHFRFFNWASAQALISDSGYAVQEGRAYGTFPLSRFLGGLGRWLDGVATRAWPGSFGFQFVFSARPVAGSTPAHS